MPNSTLLLPNELQQLKVETQLKFYSSILGVISQSFSWKLPMSFDKCKIFQKYLYFCQFYYRNVREQNNTFTKMCVSQQKMYQPKWNVAHEEKKYCRFFAENFVR